MATAVWSSISAGFRRVRSRGEVEEVQGEARGVGVHGIGLRWRGLAGTASSGALHGSALLVVSSGKRGKQLELATDVEESGEASRRNACRDGRRVAMDVEKRRRLRRGVLSSEQGKRWSKGNFVNKTKFQNSRL